jgi:hypothetical protein
VVLAILEDKVVTADNNIFDDGFVDRKDQYNYPLNLMFWEHIGFQTQLAEFDSLMRCCPLGRASPPTLLPRGLFILDSGPPS